MRCSLRVGFAYRSGVVRSSRKIPYSSAATNDSVRNGKDSGATALSLYLLQAILPFRSPCTRLLLTLMESPLSRLPSMRAVTLERPWWIIKARAYDSATLDRALAQRGIELIALHRKNRKCPAIHDGHDFAAIDAVERSRSFLWLARRR